jgi:plastocyanin
MLRLSVLGIGVVIPLLAGCGAGGPAYEQGIAPGIDAVVEMTSTLNFSPASVTIPAGGTVEWRNTAIMRHTVTADPALAKDAADVHLPPGAQAFDSGDVPAGQLYRHTFDVPGEYRYFCKPHESDGMVGTVTVQPAG